MPSRRRKPAESGKWFTHQSRCRGGQPITSLGPALGRAYPSHHQGPEGLGSEPADEPVPGPIQRGVLTGKPPATRPDIKGSLYIITSRGVSMRTLPGLRRTRYRVSSPRLVCVHANEPLSLQPERPSSVGMGPRCRYGLVRVRRCQVWRCESAHRVNSDLEPVAYPGLGDHVPRVGWVLLDFFPDLIDESS